MASIPLPALHVNPPAEQPNLLQMAAQVYGLKNQQQEQQAKTIEIQQRQQALKDQNAATAAIKSWDGKDPDSLRKGIIENGGSANAAFAAQQHLMGIKEQASKIAADDATTGAKNIETAKGKSDAIAGAVNGLKSLPDAQLGPAVQQKVQELQQSGILSPQEAQQAAAVGQMQDPKQMRDALDSIAKMHTFQSQQYDAALKTSEITKNNAEAAAAGGVDMKQMNDWLAKNPGKGPADYQAFKVTQARESEIQKETDPRVMRSKMNLAASEAQVQQAIKNGSAKDAGKLLAGGFVAPSEITARANPSFLVQAVNEARKLQPDFNPQKAEADFSVAKSPANLGFFGSAKSLTDKGGTLDQLEAVGKVIPQHDLPALNTLDDWKKAATGSGPIAKYAATALGVADDYSKVMGGGQGSDTSREQALKLIAPNLSPDQRTNAVQGIRGAVGSQINSRIGNNKVLKNMYGQQADSDPFAAFGGVKH